MKTMKKAFALLLAVVMVMSLSITAFAAETGGTISEITSSGVVEGDNITVSGASLQWAAADQSIGRYQDGWWVGVKITAPSTVNADNVSTVTYSNDGGTTWKSFDTYKDGEYWIGCWVPITTTKLDSALANNTVLQKTYMFNWDGDESTEPQTFTITIDPSNITLLKGDEVAYKTVDGTVTVRDEQLTSNTIIVEGVAGETYTAYKIFDVTQSGSAYAYSIPTDSAWLSVVQAYIGQKDEEGNTIDKGLTLTLSADGTKYVVKYVEDTFDPADFAAYLMANKPETATGTSAKAGSDGTATITGLSAGYYLVDSSLGALCILDTASIVTVVEKNATPTLTKEVLEDSTNTWGSTATADVIDAVSFKLTVNVGSIGTGIDKNYIITDTIPEGMTFINDVETVRVTANDTQWTIDEDYSLEENNDTGVVTFTLFSSKLSTLDPNTEIVISYTAKFSENPVIGTTGNTNTAVLKYGTYETVEVKATVYTYEIGEDANGNPTIVKVDGTTNAALTGVKFVLSKTVVENEENVTYYAVLDAITDDSTDPDNPTVVGYKLNSWVKEEASATSIVTDEEGNFVVQGLDADTYILTETETLEGYNLLTDTITVVVAEDGAVTYYYTSEGAEKAADSITVINNTGTELPSTGGIGTTIFYVVGSILVIGAAILLITKKRMSNVQ